MRARGAGLLRWEFLRIERDCAARLRHGHLPRRARRGLYAAHGLLQHVRLQQQQVLPSRGRRVHGAERVLRGHHLRRVDDLRAPWLVRRARAAVLSRLRVPGGPRVPGRKLRHLRRRRPTLLPGRHVLERKQLRRRQLPGPACVRRRGPAVLRPRVRSRAHVHGGGRHDDLPSLDDLRSHGTSVLRGRDVQHGPRVQRGLVRDADGGLREPRSTVLRRSGVRGRAPVPIGPLLGVPRRRYHLRNERGLLR
jgi:hypothetical protein